MFDMKKSFLIDALKIIPRETRDDLLRFAIDLPESRQDFRTIHHYTGSPSSKYEHRRTSALLRNIRNIRICMEKNLSFL